MSEETIPQMRDTIDAQAKTIKGNEDTIGQLNQTVRAHDARDAFRHAGYNEKHGDLYATQNTEGDITPELVAAFAGDWDLSPIAEASSDDGEGDTDTADDGSDALGSMDRSGSRSGDGGDGSSEGPVLSRQEYLEMQVSDPARAVAALNQGRVLLSTSGNLRAGQSATPGTNPYEPQLTSD
jgi:hypothetical protein